MPTANRDGQRLPDAFDIPALARGSGVLTDSACCEGAVVSE
jgi:hypothetical protein